MLTLLRGVLLSAAIFFSTTGAVRAPSPAQAVQIRALAEACAMTFSDCEGVPAPRLRFEPLLWEYSALGQFWPYNEDELRYLPEDRGIDEYMLLDDSLEYSLLRYLAGERDYWAEMAYAVLLHETVHYVDYHVNDNMKHRGDNGWAIWDDLCRSEELAWGVSNLWTIINADELKPRYDWREGYSQCTE